MAGPPPGDDWGQYLSHARALLEGRPYSDIGYLFSPPAWTIGPSTFPPGVPLTLVPLLAVSDEPTVLVQLLMHGFLFAFLACAWSYFSREGDRTLAWGMVALLGTGFLLRDNASYAGSDLGMCAFVWAVMALGESKASWALKRSILIGALGLGAILFRIAALPLMATLLLWAVVRRAHRLEVGWGPIVVLFVWAVAFWGVFTTFAAGTGVIDSVGSAIGAGNDHVLSESLRYEFARLGGKIARYRVALSETYLYAFPSGLANRSYHVLASGLTLLGLWIWAKRGWTRLSIALLVTTCGFLLAAPVWNPRYAWVLTPLFAYGFIRGMAAFAERFTSQARSKQWGARAAILLSVIAAATVASAPGTPQAPAAVEWREVGRILTESNDGPVRAASNRPRTLTWLTRIPAAGISPDFETFLREADRLGLTHVVLSRRASEKALIERFDSWTTTHPGVFELVARTEAVEAYQITFPEDLPFR